MGMFNYITSKVALPILGKVDFKFEIKDNDSLDAYPLLHIFLIDENRKLYKEFDGASLYDQGDYTLVHEFINYTGKLEFSFYDEYKKHKINFTAIFEKGELCCIEI